MSHATLKSFVTKTEKFNKFNIIFNFQIVFTLFRYAFTAGTGEAKYTAADIFFLLGTKPIENEQLEMNEFACMENKF